MNLQRRIAFQNKDAQRSVSSSQQSKVMSRTNNKRGRNNISNQEYIDCNQRDQTVPEPTKKVSWGAVFGDNHLFFSILQFVGFPACLFYASVDSSWRRRIWPHQVLTLSELTRCSHPRTKRRFTHVHPSQVAPRCAATSENSVFGHYVNKAKFTSFPERRFHQENIANQLFALYPNITDIEIHGANIQDWEVDPHAINTLLNAWRKYWPKVDANIGYGTVTFFDCNLLSSFVSPFTIDCNKLNQVIVHENEARSTSWSPFFGRNSSTLKINIKRLELGEQPFCLDVSDGFSSIELNIETLILSSDCHSSFLIDVGNSFHNPGHVCQSFSLYLNQLQRHSDPQIYLDGLDLFANLKVVSIPTEIRLPTVLAEHLAATNVLINRTPILPVTVSSRGV